MAGEKTIKVDGGAISSDLRAFTTDLEDFERILLDLNTSMLFSRDELRGSAYNQLFETVNELIEQQKKILFFEQVVHDELKAFVEEIGAEEQEAVSNFNV